MNESTQSKQELIKRRILSPFIDNDIKEYIKRYIDKL